MSTASRSTFRLVTLGRLALLGPDGYDEPTLRTQTRKLALLAYLALADRPLSRDHLVDVFWGEVDDRRARHSLRETLSHLRRVLGPDAIARRSEAVALSSDARLVVDARDFHAACDADACAAAIREYGGPFVDGVHVAGSRRFEEWSSLERARAERRFLGACAIEWRRRHGSGEAAGAAELAERWLTVAPTSVDAALALLASLAHPGTTDALRLAGDAHDRLAHRLATEFEQRPDARVTAAASAIAERLVAATPPRVELRAPSALPAPVTPAPVTPAPVTPAPVSPATHRAARRAARSTRIAIAGAVLATVATGALAVRRATAVSDGTAMPGGARPSLVVTGFDVSPLGDADAWLRDGAPQIVGSTLARERTVDVVDPGRVRDVLRRARYGDARGLTTDQALDVARRLGATWLVTGSVTHGGQRYLLDVSLRAVPGGRVERRVSVADTGLVTAAHRIVAGLVPMLDARPTGPRFEQIETGSTDAYRAFVQAQSLFFDGRSVEAVAALDAAIAADSDFVSALVTRRRVLGVAGTPAARDTARRLMRAFERVRDRATEFDQMDVDVFTALHDGEHRRAESLARALVARFPRDPRAYNELVAVLGAHERVPEAIAVVRRTLALDSLSRDAGSGPCASCTGYATLAQLLMHVGDFARAEAAARRAVAQEPDRPGAWSMLGEVLGARGRFDEAIAASRRASALAPHEIDYAEFTVRRMIEARRLDAADSVIRTWLVAGNAPLRLAAVDLRATILRERGRFVDAAHVLAAAARDHRDAIALQLVLGDTRARTGDVAGATRAFEEASPHRALQRGTTQGAEFPVDEARSFAWPHALLGDALYTAGSVDTTRLLAIADSVEIVGARSYFSRDWRLHLHLRGLVAMRAGRWADAERAFRASRYGPAGWTRTVEELAHAQLAQGRARDAVATLRDAYAGAVDGPGRYAPRSEIDYEMARALAAAGMADSARVYAGYARQAWREAEPGVRDRLATLDSLGVGPSIRDRLKR